MNDSFSDLIRARVPVCTKGNARHRKRKNHHRLMAIRALDRFQRKSIKQIVTHLNRDGFVARFLRRP